MKHNDFHSICWVNKGTVGGYGNFVPRPHLLLRQQTLKSRVCPWGNGSLLAALPWYMYVCMAYGQLGVKHHFHISHFSFYTDTCLRCLQSNLNHMHELLMHGLFQR